MIMYLITSFNKLSSNLNYYVFNYYITRKKTNELCISRPNKSCNERIYNENKTQY
jgi:hypothetical protein